MLGGFNRPAQPQLVPQTVYLIRHGEGFHNIGWEHNLDAHLTPNGWKQAAALKEHLRKLEPQLSIEVLSSLILHKGLLRIKEISAC